MNILVLNWRDVKNPRSGGAEIVTFEHVKSWVKKGNRVVWFTSLFSNAKPEEILSGVSVIRRGNALTVYFFAAIYYLFSGEVFDIVIDEIHGVPFFTPLYARKPKVAFIHEVAGEIWDWMYPFPINIFGRVIERLYLLMYRNLPFWADAQSVVDELVGYGINRNKAAAIPCGISNQTLSVFPKKEKSPTFIFVSRLVKMKGIEDVILAFHAILQEKPEAKLWIVGGGDDRYVNQLKRLVSDLKIKERVIFFGRVSEQKKLILMRRAHLLLHASVKEGWGLVVIEAASQYTPAVVYNVSGLKDSVKNNKTGIIVSKNTPHALAEAALNLLDNVSKYKKLQTGGVAWAKGLKWDFLTKESLVMIKRYAKTD